jgi:hypothetical protein
MVRKEIHCHPISYNLIRAGMSIGGFDYLLRVWASQGQYKRLKSSLGRYAFAPVGSKSNGEMFVGRSQSSAFASD